MSAAQLNRDHCYAQLKDYLIQSTGLAYYRDRDEELARRIGRRLNTLQTDDYGCYLEMLRAGPSGQAELDLLIAELTIGETYFFRHSEQFDALRNRILPDILERNREKKTLKIWSAGCASGAEAYSLAVLIRDEFGAPIAGWDVLIVGTDVNRRSLSQARQGLYEDWALRGMVPETRDRLFRQERGQWAIHDRYRYGVAFQYHNLVKDVAPSLLNNLFAFDLVLCRNVMIYFDRPTVAAVVERLRDCIVDQGWLVAGHADIDPQAFQAFEALSESGITFYRKAGTPFEPPTPPPIPIWEPAPGSDWPVPSAGKAGPFDLEAPAEPAPLTVRPQPASAIDDVRALADQGAWAEAANRCSVLLESAPLDPLPHFYQGLILEQMGRLAEAEKSLRRSIYLNRRFVLGHYHLGLLLQRNPESAGLARRCFENVVTLLGSTEGGFRFEHGDGITAAGLRELTKMHLQVL